MDGSADLRITYIFEDGARSDLALGRIDAEGRISVHKIAPGEEERVATLLEELNGADRVYQREGSRAPDALPGTLVKRAIARGEPEFLAALVETARRFYGVDLQFDPEALYGLEDGPNLNTKQAIDPEVEANLALDLEPALGPGLDEV